MKILKFIFTITIVVLFLGACNILDEELGIVSVPGGFLTVDVGDYWDPPVINSATNIVVAFDTDIEISNGAAFMHVIPTASYQSGDLVSGPAYIYFSSVWRAPEVTEGDYYVYYWVDINGNGVLEPGDEETTLDIYHGNDDYAYDYVNRRIRNGSGSLMPNYPVRNDYTPQLNIFHGAAIGG